MLSTDEGNVSIAKGSSMMLAVTGMSMIGGFSWTVARARKGSPSSFDGRAVEGTRLALRALGYGTLLSVTGVAVISVGVCALLGVASPKQFGQRMKEIMPQKDGPFVKKFEKYNLPRSGEKGTREWNAEWDKELEQEELLKKQQSDQADN